MAKLERSLDMFGYLYIRLDVGFEQRGGRRCIGQESKSGRRKESIAEHSLFQIV